MTSSEACNNSLGLYIDTLHSSSSHHLKKGYHWKDDGIYVKDRTEGFVDGLLLLFFSLHEMKEGFVIHLTGLLPLDYSVCIFS